MECIFIQAPVLQERGKAIASFFNVHSLRDIVITIIPLILDSFRSR
jgi:hypothetical protein